MISRKPQGKASLPIEKSGWHPSPLIGQIVLVSSRSNRGEVHAARKNWLTMVASNPPTLGLCCRLSHRTAINILETQEFVVNIPGEDLVERVWEAGDSVTAALDSAGKPAWSFIDSERVSVPRIGECRAHIECRLDATKRLNEDEVIFFARILNVSVDSSVLDGPERDRYRALRPIFYLENALYGVVDTSGQKAE